MKIVTVIGVRPQFVKAAMVSRVIQARKTSRENPFLTEIIVVKY